MKVIQAQHDSFLVISINLPFQIKKKSNSKNCVHVGFCNTKILNEVSQMSDLCPQNRILLPIFYGNNHFDIHLSSVKWIDLAHFFIGSKEIQKNLYLETFLV